MLVNDHCQRATHAEANAIVQGALHGVSLEGATAYCTHQPCVNCSKLLISAGVKQIVYEDAYPDPVAPRCWPKRALRSCFVALEASRA